MKIVILVREETADRCIGKGCFKAFNNRADAFAEYGSDAELIGFTHTGGDLEHKIARFIEHEVDVVHLSSCMRAKSDDYEALAKRLSKDFKVVGYSHGSAESKTRETQFFEKQQPISHL